MNTGTFVSGSNQRESRNCKIIAERGEIGHQQPWVNLIDYNSLFLLEINI